MLATLARLSVAGGIFDTHSKVADARLEIMAYAGAVGATPEVIRRYRRREPRKRFGDRKTEWTRGALCTLGSASGKTG